jgi:hypothetical protein
MLRTVWNGLVITEAPRTVIVEGIEGEPGGAS